MREKIKITIPANTVEPDPPPFICDVCNEERNYWELSHEGEKKMCFRHSGRLALNQGISWADMRQLAAISAIIGVIRHVRN